MLLIALATFDPRDPAPFFKAGVDGPARNFIGPFGAFLAEMLIPQLFGVASLVLPLVARPARLEALLVPADRRPLHEGGRQRPPAALAGRAASRSPSAPSASRASRCAPAARSARSWPACWWPTSAGPGPTSWPPPRCSWPSSSPRSSPSPRCSTGVGGRVGERLRALQTAWAHYRETPPQGEAAPGRHPQAHRRPRTLDGGLLRIRKVKARAESEEAFELPDDDDLPLHAPLPRARPPSRPAQKPLPFVASRPSDEEEGRARVRAPAPPAPQGGGRRPPARCAAATRCPRSRSSTRPRGPSSSTTTVCSRRAASCRRSAASSG